MFPSSRELKSLLQKDFYKNKIILHINQVLISSFYLVVSLPIFFCFSYRFSTHLKKEKKMNILTFTNKLKYYFCTNLLSFSASSFSFLYFLVLIFFSACQIFLNFSTFFFFPVIPLFFTERKRT